MNFLNFWIPFCMLLCVLFSCSTKTKKKATYKPNPLKNDCYSLEFHKDVSSNSSNELYKVFILPKSFVTFVAGFIPDLVNLLRDKIGKLCIQIVLNLKIFIWIFVK